MSTIQIIVGTVMGTALQVAQVVEAKLKAQGHNTRLNQQFQAGDLAEAKQEVTVICTSNTGMGDLPANIAPLFAHLSCDLPQITGAPYAIINLGDSSFPNFAQSGHTLDEALRDIGAEPIAEMLIIDAIYDDDPMQPLLEWLPKLEAKL